MTTLMVHLEVGHANTRLLQAAAELAKRLDASVMGIAVCQPLQILYGDAYIPGEIIDQDREEREKEIKDAEIEFRTALQEYAGRLDWRSTLTFMPASRYLADQARCADLVVTGVDHGTSLLDASNRLDIGDLVMQLGRPIIIVPEIAEQVRFERVLVAWKDSRESRRAVLDSLPLLKRAEHVAVCEVASEEGMASARTHLDDVVSWLKRDGIAAEPVASLTTGDDAARLDTIACDLAADIIVAGAYGHSRLREWALGGVTKDLLLRSARCSFVSH